MAIIHILPLSLWRHIKSYPFVYHLTKLICLNHLMWVYLVHYNITLLIMPSAMVYMEFIKGTYISKHASKAIIKTIPKPHFTVVV